MPKELSCGFILFQKGTDRLLVCHPNGKPGTGYHSFDIPKGHIEDNEEPFDAAMRELREETGYTADEWTEIGDFHPAPAYSDEYITMYMARGLHKGKQDLDEDEFLDIHTIPLSELVEDVMAGKISDAKTQVCILKAARILGL